MYFNRVFWRPQGSKQAFKNDTRSSSLFIVGLKEGIPYELVIKAGNHYGTSTFTDPVVFTLNDKYIISASTKGNFLKIKKCWLLCLKLLFLGNTHLGAIVGIIFALMLIGCAILGAVIFFRKNNIKIAGNVSFENPSFLRRNHNASDTLQIIPNETMPEVSVSAETCVGPKQEDLNAHPFREEASVMDEELRLGSNGVGFRRFK